MNFAQFEQVIRDRVKIVQVDESLDEVSAMFRVEEEVSAILRKILDEGGQSTFDNQR